MGAEYARRSGEKPEVAQAIFEHYLPRHAGDILPATELGMVVSLADKLDTIVGCFGVGIQPTGSQDPYALRRQALGICRIMLERGLEISLTDLIEQAFALYPADKVQMKLTREQVIFEISEFFKLRLRNILTEQDIAHDVLDSVLAIGFDNLADLQRRAVGLQAFRQQTEFADLLTAYLRAHNLAQHADTETIDKTLLLEPVEEQIHSASAQAQFEVSESLKQKDIARALRVLTFARRFGPFCRGYGHG